MKNPCKELPEPRSCDKPCAGPGFTSYRYRGRFGWVMIGARDDIDALNEAQRSIGMVPDVDKLQIWNGETYVNVTNP